MTEVSMLSNVSIMLQVPIIKKFSIKEAEDPCFKYDLKKHMENNSEYRKQRIEWAKTKPKTWSLFYRKDVFFDEWYQDNIPTLQNDIIAFIRIHPEFTSSEVAHAFCMKWVGYSFTYGEEFIQRLIIIVLMD
jgi:hypothetical protein